MNAEQENLTRRMFLKAGLSFGVLPGIRPIFTKNTLRLQSTPACGDHTENDVEGPFFTEDVPLRQNVIEAGMTGLAFVLTGKVLDTNCNPIPNAHLDFWQADDAGDYDNLAFKLRGRQFTDADGNYRLETLLPGLYPGRTRHIHVKANGPDGDILTTQLYFPDEPTNASDGFIKESLIMSLEDVADGSKAGEFNFVLNYNQTPSAVSQSEIGIESESAWTIGVASTAATAGAALLYQWRKRAENNPPLDNES